MSRSSLRVGRWLLVVPAALTLAPSPAAARVVSLAEARSVLRASVLSTPIWFPATSSPPFRGRPLRLTIGPGDRYVVSITGRGRATTPPSVSFGRLLVYLVDARALCLAGGGHWRIRTSARHRFSVCSGVGARTVFFVRSNHLYDVSTGTPAAVGERALRRLAAQFGPI